MKQGEKELLIEALEYLYQNYLEADETTDIMIRREEIQKEIAKIKKEAYIKID